MPVAVAMSSRHLATEMDPSAAVNKRARRAPSTSIRTKLERSRQSARECRARKKLRYQYLEELVASREKAIYTLREELNMCKQWCAAVDGGEIPGPLVAFLDNHRPQQHETLSNNSVQQDAVVTTAAERLPSASCERQNHSEPTTAIKVELPYEHPSSSAEELWPKLTPTDSSSSLFESLYSSPLSTAAAISMWLEEVRPNVVR